MRGLVLVLALLLGWTVFSHKPARPKRLYGTDGDAFPFPTTDSHAGVDVEDPQEVAQWCETFDCTEEQLRAAVKRAGRTPDAVRRHLLRRR